MSREVHVRFSESARVKFPRATRLIDRPDPHVNNLGSRGVGEPPIIPTAPAIANAIADAIGVRIKELPITREKILKALTER